MGSTIRNPSWLTANSQRRYPLAADASGLDVTGTFRLEDSFIVDLGLAVHAGLNIDPAKFFIYQIGAYATGYAVVVGYDGDDGPVVVANALIAEVSFQPNMTFRLGGVGDFVDATGWVTIGTLDDISQQPAGRWTFDLAGSRLETSVVDPQIRNVPALYVKNGVDLSKRIVGDVVVSSGSNIRVTLVEDAGEDPRIVIDAIDGEGLNAACVCPDDTAPDPIRTINGIAPTPEGRFDLLGSDCIQIEGASNGVVIRDTCAKPCCGCTELERITQDMELIGATLATMERQMSELLSRSVQMDQVVLGSRLGDRGCSSCE